MVRKDIADSLGKLDIVADHRETARCRETALVGDELLYH